MNALIESICGAIKTVARGRLAPKVAEGSRTPRPSATRGALEERASVLECGGARPEGPLPLFLDGAGKPGIYDEGYGKVAEADLITAANEAFLAYDKEEAEHARAKAR